MDAKKQTRQRRIRQLLQELAKLHVGAMVEAGDFNKTPHFGTIERAIEQIPKWMACHKTLIICNGGGCDHYGCRSIPSIPSWFAVLEFTIPSSRSDDGKLDHKPALPTVICPKGTYHTQLPIPEWDYSIGVYT